VPASYLQIGGGNKIGTSVAIGVVVVVLVVDVVFS